MSNEFRLFVSRKVGKFQKSKLLHKTEDLGFKMAHKWAKLRGNVQ
jgi:hypothetical protein